MDQNILTGDIPLSFGNLNLSANELLGTIPTVLNDLTLLSELDLSLICKEKYQEMGFSKMLQLFHSMVTGNFVEGWNFICLHAMQFQIR